MSLSPSLRDLRLASRDLVSGLASWPIWSLLGMSDIRQRYHRSKFGQFWITLSMGIFIAGLGAVYSILFNQPVHEYVPFLAVNITIWTLMSGVIGDASTVFVGSALYLRQDNLPKTTFVMRLLTRNLIVLAHNLVILPVTFLAFQFAPSPLILLAIPGLILLMAVLFTITLILGILATRFRDLPQVIQNALQLLFFTTPVMWHAEQITPDKRLFVTLNPFGAMLQIVSEPLRGIWPSPGTYLTVVVFLLILVAVGLPLFARFRARLVYWL